MSNFLFIIQKNVKIKKKKDILNQKKIKNKFYIQFELEWEGKRNKKKINFFSHSLFVGEWKSLAIQ